MDTPQIPNPSPKLDPLISKINNALKNLNNFLNDTNKIEEQLRYYKMKKGIVFYKCNNCGNIDYMSYSTWRRKRTCSRCGSNNIVKITRKEFIELKKKEIIENTIYRIRYLEFLKDVALLLSRNNWYKDRLEFDGSWLIFDYPSKISLMDNEVVISFHWFNDDDLKLLDKIIELARKHDIKVLKINIDGRPDHCRISKEEMLKHGFRETFMGDYEKVIHLQ